MEQETQEIGESVGDGFSILYLTVALIVIILVGWMLIAIFTKERPPENILGAMKDLQLQTEALPEPLPVVVEAPPPPPPAVAEPVPVSAPETPLGSPPRFIDRLQGSPRH